MITVNIHEANTRLSELVKAVEERNETVVLCRDGREIAESAAASSGGRCAISHPTIGVAWSSRRATLRPNRWLTTSGPTRCDERPVGYVRPPRARTR